jgi:hypothetical protein
MPVNQRYGKGGLKTVVYSYLSNQNTMHGRTMAGF